MKQGKFYPSRAETKSTFEILDGFCLGSIFWIVGKPSDRTSIIQNENVARSKMQFDLVTNGGRFGVRTVEHVDQNS